MTLVVSNSGEKVALEKYLKDADKTLKLYSNNVTPGESDTAATFTEVAGGGYGALTLSANQWTITEGAPSYGAQSAVDFEFTGATSAPGTIYGYFVVSAIDGTLRWAERFPGGVVPLTPGNGTLIRINPRFECS